MGPNSFDLCAVGWGPFLINHWELTKRESREWEHLPACMSVTISEKVNLKGLNRALPVDNSIFSVHK